MTYDNVTLIQLVKTEQSNEKVCSEIVQDLKDGNITIQKLVEQLGDLLTNKEILIRRGGIEILSNVLQQLPASLVSSKGIEHLTGYFSSCLIDHHSFTTAVLGAFLALMNMEKVPNGVASKIFTVMNLHFSCQSQVQADRSVCYRLFQIMMRKKIEELQALGPDFVCGYLSIIDSERDPRNLMYLFENYPTFLQHFPPGHLLEDAFEAVACYFPVDFRTNANDPRGITRKDLSEALMPSLTAIPEFCPHTIALVMDKLSSDLKLAKLDSLLLLKRCMDDFHFQLLSSHITEISSSLLNELKPGLNEADVQDLSLDVLCYLIKYLSSNNKTEELIKTLDAVILSVKHFINDVQSSFFPPAVKFLSKIASSCATAAECIVSVMIPKLLGFNTENEVATLTILESYKLLLLPCVEFKVNCAEMKEIADMWFQVPNFFLIHCRSPKKGIKISAIDGMILIIELFRSSDRQTLFSLLCDNVTSEDDTVVREKCLESICMAGKIFQIELKNTLDLELMIVENSMSSDKQIQKRIFQVWSVIAPIPGFLSYLESNIKQRVVRGNYEFAEFVINELKYLINREKNNTSFLKTLHDDSKITKHLIDWWHEHCAISSDLVDSSFDEEKTAQNIQHIICAIVRVLDEKSQLKLIIDYNLHYQNLFRDLNLNGDSNGPSINSTLIIITLESLISGSLPIVLKKTLSENMTQIIKSLSTVAVFCSRPFCCPVACRCIASIFNKLIEVPLLNENAKFLFEYASNIIDTNNGVIKINAINMLLYVTKSILLCGFVNLNLWLNKILSLIVDEEVSPTIAEGFKMITTEDEYFLNATCHFQIKLFYRQRLFSYIVPKLVPLVKNADQKIKKNCAISAIYAMQELPHSVISKYIKDIVPLLTELLDFECDSSVSLTTLKKINSLFPTNKAIFEEYIEIFLPKLMSLAKNASNMKVRMVALQCIAEYSTLNPIKILPVKPKIVHELTACLDDRKRLVRQEAVKARTKWIILGM